jgi:Putative auto-transporter adhesin, head GIN domain
MKKLLALTFTITILWAQAQETQTRSIGSFTGVRAEEGIDVFLKKGSKESVRVEVSGTSLENVITELSGSYLKVHMRSGDYRGSVDVKVYVTYVKIDKLSASSAGSIFSEGSIDADALELSASSAGNVDLTINAGTVEVNASSAGEVELQGTANTLVAEAASAGEIDAYDLIAKKVEAEASSAGSIKVSVAEELDAHASSGASIRYRGNPNKSITNSTSGGSVKKSN